MDIAYKLVEVIAKGHCETEGQYKLIIFGDYKAVLRRPRGKFKKEKRDEEWLLTGYQIEKAGYNFILESADSMAVKSAPFKNPDQWSADRFTMPTNPPPFGPRQRMGAANSELILGKDFYEVNLGWLYDL